MEDLNIDKIVRDLDTLSFDEAKTKLNEATAAIEQLEENIKKLKDENTALKETHPAINKDSEYGKLFSILLRPEAYRKAIMVCRRIAHLLINHSQNAGNRGQSNQKKARRTRASSGHCAEG
jgi:multidrug resistance efflux pump